MGNQVPQAGWASWPHLLKLLRLTQPVGQEGLGAWGDEVDGESEETQLQDAHVVLAQLCRVVHANPRGVVHAWCRRAQSQKAGQPVTM